MMTIRQKIVTSQNLLLLAILALALLLRLWGISFGLPYVGSYDDEMFIADNALDLLRQGRLDFSKWNIGSAQIYLQVLIGKIILAFHGIEATAVPTYSEIITIEEIKAAAVDVPYPLPEFYFWGRASVAILGGASVFILYLIGQEIKSKRVGLISAFFLAVNSLHAEHSHYLTRTAPGAFFLLLTFYVILLAYLEQKWTLYLLSLPLLYLSIYVKQNNLILLAPLSLALSISLWREFQRRPAGEMVKYISFVLSLAIVGFSLSWFFFQFSIFAYSQLILDYIFRNTFVFGGYQFGYTGNTPQWIIDQLFISPQVNLRLVTFLALPGSLLAIKLKEKAGLLLAIFVPYLLMMSFFTVRFANWLVPLVPILAVWAALTLDWIYEQVSMRKIMNPRYLPALFCLLVVLIPGASIRTIITLNYYATQPDVRQIAAEWLQANLPAGSRVVVDSWGPYLAKGRLEVVYVGFAGEKDIQTYRHEQVDYIVLNSMNFSRLVLAGGSDPRDIKISETRARQVQQIMKELTLEREFVGPALFNPPVINVLVYRVQ